VADHSKSTIQRTIAADPVIGEQQRTISLQKVTDAVLAVARVHESDQVVDLGCRTGQISLPLAERGADVLAVDPSFAAVTRLQEIVSERSLAGIRVLSAPLETLSLPPESADVVVTCYALHGLPDADKARIVRAAYQWLRPGGLLIVADMMFGRGGTSRDRAIIRSKIRSLARKGIGGWWRIAKNSYRYLIRAQDHPASISAWTAMLASAGFSGITASSIVNEAGLVSGRRPAA
jgi:ubiquinone/menaquinone biosynthesis C-methylase UbiE